MKPKQNNYAFIDSQNLNLGVRSQGWRLDFARLRIYLKDKYGVSKAFLCIGYIPGNQALYTYLQKSGFICIFKPTLEVESGKIVKIKGNVDADLVLHAMIEYNHYDQAIIISGDGDFYCLIDYLKTQSKLARIIIPNRKKYSRLLWKFRVYLDFLNNLEHKLGKTK